MKEDQLLSTGVGKTLYQGGNTCFILVIFFLLGLFGKIDAFQPLSPQEVPQGKMMKIHNGMFYHSMDPFYHRVSRFVLKSCDCIVVSGHKTVGTDQSQLSRPFG